MKLVGDEVEPLSAEELTKIIREAPRDPEVIDLLKNSFRRRPVAAEMIEWFKSFKKFKPFIVVLSRPTRSLWRLSHDPNIDDLNGAQRLNRLNVLNLSWKNGGMA